MVFIEIDKKADDEDDVDDINQVEDNNQAHM